jgi:hypothetical protein
MRKFILSWLAMGALLSCQQISAPEKTELQQQETPFGTLMVNLIVPSSPETKTPGGSTNEDKVNTLQIFVFKDVSESNPTLNVKETDKWVSDGSTTLTINTYKGKKRVWALVNAPRQSFDNEQALMTHYSKLEENSPTNLVMVGKALVDVQEYNAAASLGTPTAAPITVYRLGARISIRNINLDFTNTSLEGCYLDIKEVYILNAVNSVSLGGTPRTTAELGPSNACWYNLEAWSESIPAAAKDILGDRGNLNLSIGPSTGTQDINRFFYVYPNISPAANDNTDATPSPRLTRLILHAYIRGAAGRGSGDNAAHAEESYYCFDIPKSTDVASIESNHTYDIESITITMAGGISDQPDKRPKYGKVSATVSVGKWGGHTTLTYEL